MATKKRVHVCNGEDDEEQEEEKMEQFFVLVRNFHEAVNRRKDELRLRDIEKKNKNKIRRVDEDDDEQSSWVPTFEWEDFNEEIEFRRSSYEQKDDDKKIEEDEDDALDLRLTL